MIIDGLIKFFGQCPLMKGEAVDVDFLGKALHSFSINPVQCEPVIKKYASGGSMKQYCFILSARVSYGREQTCENAAFFEKLAEWIEEKNKLDELPDIGEEKTVQSIEVTALGQMTQEDIHSAGYAMRCRLVYTEN